MKKTNQEQDEFMLTNDVAFQCVFGKPGQEKITKRFIERILNIEIEDLTLDVNKRLLGEAIDDKIGRLDVKAKLNDGTRVLIEMQVARYEDIEKRMLYYWSHNYIDDLKKGESYSDLRKTIAVLIYSEDISALKNIPKYHTKWQIREEEYSSIILTGDLEIHIIELRKFDENKEKTEEADWLRLIKKGEIDMDSKQIDKELKEAKEELERITADPETRELYYQREKDLRDKISMAVSGIKQGRAEGEAKIKEMIKAMHNDGLSIERIIKISGLSKKEVEKIIARDASNA